MVDPAGLEPATSTTSMWRSSQLSYGSKNKNCQFTVKGYRKYHDTAVNLFSLDLVCCCIVQVKGKVWTH